MMGLYYLILHHLPTVRAHPGTRYEFTINPLIQSLHLVGFIRVLAELVFDVHARCIQLSKIKR